MSARAMASTTISFGLVSLPVKLYSTGEPGRRVSFNLVHGECGTRLKQHYVCPQCDREVGRDEMAKGYEFAKGQYVLFKEDELKAIEAPKTDGIEITEFVPTDRVSAVYLDRPYYLGADKGGARAYRLLSAALRETERVAIAKYATRGKQYLVVVRPHGEGLVLDQLRYADEVRSFDGGAGRVRRGEAHGAHAGATTHRSVVSRDLRAREIHRRGTREDAGVDPVEGRGRRDHGCAGGGAENSDHRSDGGAQGVTVWR